MSDEPRGAVRLAHLGVIEARGADAASFLNGQLTRDVASMAPGESRLAGFCSAKGRLQATFQVQRVDADTFRLVCSADLLEATRKRLSMFVLRAKCRLEDAGGALDVWGAIGFDVDGAMALPAFGGVPRSLVTVPAGVAMARPAAPGGEASLDDWLRLEVESGLPRIVAATVDRFVPQMVNLELVGGVDFQKGCYPGQEVVARSQYRGTLKRRGFLLRGIDASAAPGDDVFADGADGEPAGTIVNVAPDGAGAVVCFAELRLAALAAAAWRLRGAEGPRLERRPLPYDVPLAADAPA